MIKMAQMPRAARGSRRHRVCPRLRTLAASDAQQLINHDLCRATLDRYPPKCADNDAAGHPFVNAFTDADRRAKFLVQPLDTRGHVYPVAHHSVAQTFRRADIADDDRVTMHPEADVHLPAA